MCEASTMEENYDWNNLGSAQGLLKLYNAILSLICRGRLVNPVKKAGGSIDMIKGKNPINWDYIGLDFTVKKLC